jgi:ABC-type sugar transport system permease subunit
VTLPDASPAPVADITSRGAKAIAHRVSWRFVARLLYILPAGILVGGLILAPTAVALYHSFFDWRPGGDSPFVGLDNFVQLAESPAFRQVLVNEAFYLLGLPLWTVLPLAIALLFYQGVPAAGLFRTIVFFPSILSPAIMGVLFHALLAPQGFVNEGLRAIGLGDLTQEWLDNASLVKPVLICIIAWAQVGIGVVIFGAALSAISPELFEAAEMDGASFWQRLRYVMLPALRGTVRLWVVYQVLSVFLFLFGWIYVLTHGGPGYASATIDYDIYQNSIANGQFGIGSAESVYLVIIVFTVLLIGRLISRRTEHDQ